MKNNNLKIFAKYVSLNVMGMLALSCYILADTYFVANGIGPNGLTALNLAIPVYSFINGVGLMIGMGGSTKYSILKAGEKNAEANQAFTHALAVGSVLTILFLILGIGFADTLTMILGADENVFDMTHTYLKILLLFSPAFILNNIVTCFVRNDGNPGLAMAAMAFGSFSNIIFDYIFIFPCQLGILGAVIATGFAPVVGLIISARHFIRNYNDGKWHCVHLVKTKAAFKPCLQLCSLGISSLITEVASGIVMIVFNLIILDLAGNIGVAAYGIIANLSLVVTAIFTGIAQGIQPIVSHAYGQRDMNVIQTYFRYSMILSVGLAVLIYLIVTGEHIPLIAAFNETGNMVLFEIAKEGIYLYFTAFIFVGINIISSAMFGSANCPIPAFILSIMRGFVVIIPCIVLLAMLLEMRGVWLAFPMAEGITTIAAIIILIKFFHSHQG